MAGSSVAASAQAVRMRVVAISSTGSVWRLDESSVDRAGATATAWFFLDNRDRRGERRGTSRVRYRFHCVDWRVQRLERVDLAVDGRVMGRSGAQAEGPAGRGTFAGKLLEAACG